jgi:hypothetical protein
MDKPNKFIESINISVEQLPLTYRFVQLIGSPDNLPQPTYIPPVIQIKYYESSSIETSGFHRPISKIIRFTEK